MVSWKSKLRSWGYEPIFCSVETKTGLDSLQFNLRDQTTVIVGPSGVGKSSLINALRSNHFGLTAAQLDDSSSYSNHVNLISASISFNLVFLFVFIIQRFCSRF